MKKNDITSIFWKHFPETMFERLYDQLINLKFLILQELCKVNAKKQKRYQRKEHHPGLFHF